jgi:imidazolonepropionase-like amidohydrolase
MSVRLLLVLVLLAAPAAAQDVAIRAGHVVVRAGAPPLENATILIRNGSVVAVGTDVDVPSGVRVEERPDAWAVPAFVDVGTALGLVGDTDEVTRAVEPDLSTAAMIDPTHRDFAAARAAGLGTCAILPGDRNLFGGEGTVLKTNGQTLAGLAKLALGPSILRAGRKPTSRMGALALLRERLAAAHRAEGHANALGRFARGVVPGVVTVAGTQDMLNILELADRYGLRIVFRPAANLEVKHFEGVPLAGQRFVLGPYTLGTGARTLRIAGHLAEAEADVSFASAAPLQPASGLRLTAVLAVRYGLSAPRALHALTEGGAAAVGLTETIGSLEPGKHGDVTVLSGPPLDLRSRVLELYLNGKRVHRRPALVTKDGP